MSNILKRTVNTPDDFNLQPSGRNTLYDKIYHGFVKDTNDLQRNGRLLVWIPELGGDPNDSNNWTAVMYCSPFAGATSFYNNKNGSSYLDSQRSYGMWFVPPDTNNEVIVAFINGDPAKGVWLGCLFQQYMNHMVPGIPGNESSASSPVVEYNKKISQGSYETPRRPIYSPLSDQLDKQGLSSDPVRGVTTSGARRDDPANDVYGILTPGGNQFVFDDNPLNKYIRLRTQSGAQVLINDTTGCIYLNSVDGKNWISLDATGKIDLYAFDDITIRSQGSVNIRGDLDVNIEAGRDINMRARGKIPIEPTPNTSNPPIPDVPSNGPITVIGDSIAVGIGSKIENALTFAEVGINSSTILSRVLENTNLANAVNTILSVGSNDSNQILLASNLNKIREALGQSNFIWILPYDTITNTTVKTFVTSKGDKYIDLKQYPSNDNIHPKDYAVVANDAKALCVSTPRPNAGTNFTSSDLIAEGSSWYNAGVYKTLEEAKSEQAKYRSMADNARSNPQNYTDPPGGYDAVMKFEAAADAEVRRLSGQSPPTAATPAATGTTATTSATSPTGTTSSTTTTTSSTATTGTAPTGDFATIATQFIQKEERLQLKAYADGGSTMYSIGYGHSIGWNEIPARKSSIDCGVAGSVPLVGSYGKDTTMNKDQAEALFQIDLRYNVNTIRRVIGGAWEQLNAYQQSAVASLCYNIGSGSFANFCGGNKFTNFIYTNEVKSAADMIRNFKSNAPQSRRVREAALYEGHPEVAAAGGGASTPEGYPPPTNGYNASANPQSVLKGGFIRIQSGNDMHILSDNNIFFTSKQDQSRVTGGNMYDTVVGGTSRVTNGSVVESIGGGYGVGVQGAINLDGARIDLNGIAPPAGTPGVSAIGPRQQKQTDSVLNSIGNATPILSDTILPHLPYHEPFQNHGGRNFQNIRSSTNTDKNTDLRDGEVIKTSEKPLDVYGTPRSNMPPGVYIGAAYNNQKAPIFNYNGPLTGIYPFQKASAYQLSTNGRSFITSRENGSYRPITLGNPLYTEIGYGHVLTPEEISSGKLTIKGLSVSLNEPITQQQINDLFDEDMDKVLTWMRPLIKVGVTQSQFDMLASLAWNIGQANFTSSDVIKYLNEGNLQKVPNNWMIWTVDGNNQVVSGLVGRRVAESTNFMLGPDADKISNIPVTSQ